MLDGSLDKKGKILIYEDQPLLISALGGRGSIDCEGGGNIFINSIDDRSALQNGINALKARNTEKTQYILVESQQILEHVARKTELKKPGNLTYRIITIATKEGFLNYFIAKKPSSEDINFHKREKMKCYFEGKDSESPWLIHHAGLKDNTVI